MLSVASVTVAFNAGRMLPSQIEALLRQTQPLQEIVVVDNASTDGTRAMLAERYPQITILRMNANIGMAGAWAAGLAYAVHEKGYDWVWTFDDDSVPAEDSLAKLLEGICSLNGVQGEVGMIAPMPVHNETGRSYPPLFWRNGYVRPNAGQMREPLWFADMVIASGCLIRREVVQRIGLPRADFFMDFFDFEYCLRARSHGYKIAVINDAILAHEIGNAHEVRLAGYSRLWPAYPPWREYYLSRNLTFAGWWLYPNWKVKGFVIRHLAKHAIGVLLFSSQKLGCLRKMAQGMGDGLNAQLGVRFGPK